MVFPGLILSISKSIFEARVPISTAEFPNKLYFGTRFGFIFCCFSRIHFRILFSIALLDHAEKYKKKSWNQNIILFVNEKVTLWLLYINKNLKLTWNYYSWQYNDAEQQVQSYYAFIDVNQWNWNQSYCQENFNTHSR